MRGFSTLELLIGATLTLILASGSLLGLKAVLKMKEAQSQLAVDTFNLMRLEQLLLHAHDGDNSHNLDLNLRIHSPGTITFIDGSTHPVHGNSEDLKPDSTSTAVTFTYLAPELTYYPKTITVNAGGAKLDACRIKDRFPSQTTSGLELVSVVTLAVDGMAEMLVKEISNELDDGCRTFHLQRCQSMITGTTPEISFNSIAAILPIIEQATLYVSTAKEVRYLAHHCGETTENQPVLSHIDLLACEQNSLLQNHSEALGCNLRTLSGREVRTSTVRMLGITNGLSLIMNRT